MTFQDSLNHLLMRWRICFFSPPAIIKHHIVLLTSPVRSFNADVIENQHILTNRIQESKGTMLLEHMYIYFMGQFSVRIRLS